MKSIKFFVAALVLVAAVPMFGQTATDDLDVTATVDAVCTISTTAVAFGVYDPLAAVANDNQGTVVVTCTRGSSGLSIDLGAGSNNGSGPIAGRAMDNGAGEFLSYELYTSAGRATVWGSGASGVAIADAPSSAARTFDVFGRIPALQDAAVGSYADVVVATINY